MLECVSLFFFRIKKKKKERKKKKKEGKVRVSKKLFSIEGAVISSLVTSQQAYVVMKFSTSWQLSNYIRGGLTRISLNISVVLLET